MEKVIECIKEYKWQVGLPVIAVVVVASFLLFRQSAQPVDQTGLTKFSLEEQTSSSQKVIEETSTEASEKNSKLVVDVKGAVINPGLYTLETGARINDAIAAAGGFTSQADQKSINLAQKLTDETVVYVASQGENISVVPNSSTSSALSQEGNKSGLVNLNTATVADLQTISGIGAKRAADIIAYREANGSFKSVDDLSNVSGIGDKTLESIRSYVTVG
ncbi:helix-hairpin-helix domain-containing protein [Streptococcus ruminantium]|uniref:Helix-hairpin-helix domain-containing protein n=1 Tax=Streptococcus ruminantium TaxID=1917441 RepID=A0ABU1B4M1_9STRE|nr:helix-hairpin-helix domain-containing protein [Streptococcus ruminantium]MDQ8759424.1 helix-hairpin-helix domain-containing protein [Streptococcus ruminantium]MDQ8765569.1 helix-hairpin-helix domain-containing protein [Streptococcus ruminantium]MDQ8767143.1 helix-hairpin-helix domain-containing protein [Streptococcus ruminantium]MDQ8769505.1 helix-hairpin-helix domain-containing protein [Streptococcus ruminantium]MDQ8775314.1 helix-hairpin-helix domain-containing protein [Streptococcus rumi